MITPLFAIPAATSAISSGVAATSRWPIADCATPGRSWAKAAAGGNTDRAPKGRSIGGTSPNPKASAAAASLSAPRSRPILANVVLHDTLSAARSGPPQASLPKLWSVRVVWGSFSSHSVGYEGESGVIPFCRAAADVTTLNVEPGK